MKNLVYFFLSNLILVTLLLLGSCTRHEDNGHVQAVSSQPSTLRIVIADSAANRGLQKKDTCSSREKMSKKSTDDLMHWAGYSTLNGN